MNSRLPFQDVEFHKDPLEEIHYKLPTLLLSATDAVKKFHSEKTFSKQDFCNLKKEAIENTSSQNLIHTLSDEAKQQIKARYKALNADTIFMFVSEIASNLAKQVVDYAKNDTKEFISGFEDEFDATLCFYTFFELEEVIPTLNLGLSSNDVDDIVSNIEKQFLQKNINRAHAFKGLDYNHLIYLFLNADNVGADFSPLLNLFKPFMEGEKKRLDARLKVFENIQSSIDLQKKFDFETSIDFEGLEHDLKDDQSIYEEELRAFLKISELLK